MQSTARRLRGEEPGDQLVEARRVLARFLDGDVETGPMGIDHVTAEERAQGIALSCRVYPRSNVKLRVLGSKRAASLTSSWPFARK